jgi:hypothetical protein
MVRRRTRQLRYADEAVREWPEGLRKEPWFARILVLINSGHGYSLLAESGEWSGVRDPQEGRPHLYDARTDWLQRKYLAARHPLLARPLLDKAEHKRRFNDYLLDQGRVWPRPSF